MQVAEPISDSVPSAVIVENFFPAWTVEGRAVGFMNSDSFIRFLDEVELGEKQKSYAFTYFVKNPIQFVRESGFFLAVIFIFVGGFALILTPCILPMIPINLAIIGAGSQAGSKGHGLRLELPMDWVLHWSMVY